MIFISKWLMSDTISRFKVLDSKFRERVTAGKVYSCQMLLTEGILKSDTIIPVGDVMDIAL